jgi:hypothetical protein
MTARPQTLDFEWRLQALRGLPALMVALGRSFTILMSVEIDVVTVIRNLRIDISFWQFGLRSC